MPGFDARGPLGHGPGTGWGLGPCGGGMRYGRRGRGFGWRRSWGYYPSSAPSKEEEVEILSEEARILEQELKTIKSRLNQLKGKKNN